MHSYFKHHIISFPRCEVHPDQSFDFENPGDALKHAPRGGCTLTCEDILNCGHKCNKICHLVMEDHSKIKCQVPCERKRDAGIHSCKKACYIICGSNCAEFVRKKLPCGHLESVRCATVPENASCMKKMEKEFPLCQHIGIVPCSSNMCPSPCTFQVPCGHSCLRTCHLNDDPDHLRYICHKPCSELKKNCSWWSSLQESLSRGLRSVLKRFGPNL
jgi:hypothetical protein